VGCAENPGGTTASIDEAGVGQKGQMVDAVTETMKAKMRGLMPHLIYGLGLLINGMVLCLIIFSCFLAWALKDGLGPDSVESTGLEAIRRWGEGMGQMLLLMLLPLSVGTLLCRIGSRLDSRRVAPPTSENSDGT
jgi:hypothetical protein